MMAGFDESGTLDAAVLLLALGEETAAAVFKHLSPKEVQCLGEVMARTQYTTKDHVNQVLDRFHAQASEQSTLVHDSNAYVREVLRRALGEDKAGMLIDRIMQGSDVTGIESLRWMDAPSVAELVRNEHPQIIASILVHLERDQASAILLQLTQEMRADVVLRIATLDGIQPNALKELNEALSRVLSGGDQVKRTRLGGSKTAAEIINFLGGSAEGALLETIREEDPDLAQAIEDQMFTFDDLIDLDDKAIQILLREIQGDELIIALKGADQPLRDKIFRNMSQRAAETVREDLEAKGPVKLSEVEARHKEILKTVRRLAEEGQIAVGGGSGDEFV
jgi:flagellar motor switch protein FliG